MPKIVKITEGQLSEMINRIISENELEVMGRFDKNEQEMSEAMDSILPMLDDIKAMYNKITNPKTKDKIIRCLENAPNLKLMARTSFSAVGALLAAYLVIGSFGTLSGVAGAILSTLNISAASSNLEKTNFSKLKPEFESMKKCLYKI
jgi:hypothetical protein